MSKVTAYYHIVFCTKAREMTIPLELRDDVYRFIWKEITKHNCRLIRIGGIQNHIHLLVDLHPTVALSKLLQDIKSRSSCWMKSDSRFQFFRGWGTDYYGCTISPEHKDAVIEYIKSQDTHHNVKLLDAELMSMCHYAEVNYDNRDFR